VTKYRNAPISTRVRLSTQVRPRKRKSRLRSLRSTTFLGAALGGALCCAAAATPLGAAAAAPVKASGAVKVSQEAEGGPTIEPQVCASCKPPLIYQGGPVLSTDGPAGLTITPVWWQPGGKYKFPATYMDILNRYISDVAAASGSDDNVYSVDTEYYQIVDGLKQYVTYKVTAGTPLLDSDAFPANGCKPAPGYSACITDAQLRTELTAVIQDQKLPTTLAFVYPMFFPPGVETEDLDGTNSANDYCGYHRAYGSGAAQTVYADMPYEPGGGGCDAGQAPNGDLAADGEVSTLTHELNEAITDPLDPQYAWGDGKGNEIGDMCSQAFGGALGHTSASNPSSSQYNQVINGDKYYIQSMFSNLAFAKSGVGKGCALSEALAEHPQAGGTGTGITTIGNAFTDAYPTTLAANGQAASTITVFVEDQDGNYVQGDHVHFSTGVEYGSGLCGKLSQDDAVTNANGQAIVTYKASKYNVQCWVLAVESEGGRGSESVIYQGNTQQDSPVLSANFPTSLRAGGPAATFTMKASNPSSHPLPDAQVNFYIWPGTGATKSVDASQVNLSYSTRGAGGPFAHVALYGSTAGGSAITGYLGSAEGATMAPHSTETITFHVSLARNLPVSNKVPLISFEGYLNQINSATGGGTTVGDTQGYDIKVL
jgi:Bacterial Ig-like domain (group 1)/Phosphate-induced protein 1 conserved region